MNVAALKKEIRIRDGKKCLDCGMTSDEHVGFFGRELHVHRLNPGAVYQRRGCVTLCRCCHQRRHGTHSFIVEAVVARMPKTDRPSPTLKIEAFVSREIIELIETMRDVLPAHHGHARKLNKGEVITYAIRRLALDEVVEDFC